MKVAIVQPYFFPYIGYYSLVNAVDVFVFYDDVQYIRRGWINRNRLLNRDRPELWEYVNVPVKRTSRESRILDMEISGEREWIAGLRKTLTLRYSRTPFFRYVQDLLFDIIGTGSRTMLSEFNIHCTMRLCSYLGIRAEFKMSSTLDYSRDLDAKGKLIDISRRLEADTYINPIGGTELYRRDEFLKDGLDLLFLKMNDIRYAQGHGDFVPNLSIIDVLAWNSLDDVKRMLKDYVLV